MQDNDMRIDEEIRFIVDMIMKCKNNKFTGNIQINIKLGGISNINKLESFMIDKQK